MSGLAPAPDQIVVLDFEATCEPGTAPDPQEIIEFPSVLLSLNRRTVLDEFSTFVRPTAHPTLSAFCNELTGITQADVDGAEPFEAVFHRHQQWLAGHGLVDGAFVFATCGDWDLNSMLPRQCAAQSIPIPDTYRRWHNVKRSFAAATSQKAQGMTGMLESLGLKLEGRHHRGIDDCRNIARIVLELHARGASFEVTKSLLR